MGGLTCSIITYWVQWDQGFGDELHWSDLAGVSSQLTSTTFTHSSGVSAYNTYRFRIAAKNKYGFGSFGPVGAILAAISPDVVNDATTTHAGTQTQVQWGSPNDNGSAVTQYEVQFQGKDGNFYTLTQCDGSQTEVVTSRSCSVGYAVLRASPLLLTLGDPVFVKVRSKNVIAWSLYGATSTGTDVIRTEPLAPPSLVVEGSQTSDI